MVGALVGCDDGAGQPCILDSDCPDFNEVCIAEVCQPRGGSTEAGVDRDAGPGSDAGGGMDAGDSRDAGAPSDGSIADGATGDAGPLPDGAMPCGDPTGTWSIDTIRAMPCGSAMTGYPLTIGSSSMGPCAFTVESADMETMPAVDGTLVLDADDMLDPATSSLDVGGAGAMLCSGAFDATGETLGLTCGSCVLDLTRM